MLIIVIIIIVCLKYKVHSHWFIRCSRIDVYILLHDNHDNINHLIFQDKLVDIPEPEKQWKPEDPPEFVRFYMGKRNEYKLLHSILF